MNISVLLPIYIKDEAPFFKDCLESIFNQTLLPSEIIIIKDGIIQESINSIISEYINLNKISIVEFQFETNQGMGIAFAKGVELCNSELIARMDADDICIPDRFELQHNQFAVNPILDICGGWMNEFNEKIEDILSVKTAPESHDAILKYSKKRNPFNHPTVMFKKMKCIEAGNYMPKKYYEDYNLWVRMLLKGAIGYNIPKALCYFRTNENFFLRRGDMSKLSDEVQAMYEFYKMNHISIFDFVHLLAIRVFFRILPSFIRKFLYQKLLRSKL
jgi:glycosyltransferase involved in cell wall biosynthesis